MTMQLDHTWIYVTQGCFFAFEEGNFIEQQAGGSGRVADGGLA
jgi:hypothetical protein